MEMWRLWTDAFGDLPPIGHLLRRRIRERWVRLYSLEDGDRLPANENDMSVVLARENLIATSVLGLGARVLAWIQYFDSPPITLDHSVWLASRNWPNQGRDEREADALEGGEFLGRLLNWSPGVLDTELRLRARDELGPLTLFSPALGSCICPYDGGCDAFLRTPEVADGLRALFSSWVSPHEEGL